MTNAFEESVLRPEDYTGEDGLLYCGKCRTPKQFRMDKPPFEGKLLPRRCRCEQERYEQEEADRARRKQLKTIEKLKCRGFTEPAMREWTFANDNGKCPQMDKAHFYVDHWEDMLAGNIGYLLWGSFGTGTSQTGLRFAPQGAQRSQAVR